MRFVFIIMMAVIISGCGGSPDGTDVIGDGASPDAVVVQDVATDLWQDDGADRPDDFARDAADVCFPDADVADARCDVVVTETVFDTGTDTAWDTGADTGLDTTTVDTAADEAPDVDGPDLPADSGNSEVTVDTGYPDVMLDSGAPDSGQPDLPDPCAAAGQPCFITSGACRSDGFEICLPDGTGTECDAPPIEVGPEVCDGFDNDCDAETDNIPSALTKRAVLNCYADSSRAAMLPVADCWDMLAPDTGVSPSPTVHVDVQFVDAVTPCNPADGINMCVSSAITTCTGATLTDACITEMAFEILLFGTQYRYTSASGNISSGFDKSQDSVVGALQVLNVPAGSPAGCTILYNTFSCPDCN